MMKKACGVHKLAWALLLIGGLNWLLVGLLSNDLFGLLGLGMSHWLARLVYVLVGLSALSMLGLKKCCLKGCGCGSEKSPGDCCMKGGDAHKM